MYPARFSDLDSTRPLPTPSLHSPLLLRWQRHSICMACFSTLFAPLLCCTWYACLYETRSPKANCKSWSSSLRWNLWVWFLFPQIHFAVCYLVNSFLWVFLSPCSQTIGPFIPGSHVRASFRLGPFLLAPCRLGPCLLAPCLLGPFRLEQFHLFQAYPWLGPQLPGQRPGRAA